MTYSEEEEEDTDEFDMSTVCHIVMTNSEGTHMTKAHGD